MKDELSVIYEKLQDLILEASISGSIPDDKREGVLDELVLLLNQTRDIRNKLNNFNLAQHDQDKKDPKN